MLKEITSFRFSAADKAALLELANRLQMKKSDVVRSLVRETLTILKEKSGQSENKNATPGRKV